MLIFRAVFIFPTTISSYLSVCFLNQRTRLSTAVTVRKLTLIQCYLLILRPHSDSASCPSNALDRSKTSQDHVLHLVVSLVSFSMEQLFSLPLSYDLDIFGMLLSLGFSYVASWFGHFRQDPP